MITYLPMAGKKQRTAGIICAYTEDRWPELVTAVESVQGQRLLPDEIVIVIDHNPALLARTRERFADLTIVENPDAKGLSNARNAGIAATKANLLAFLDDDAAADPDWLKLMLETIQPPNVVGVGGRVVPQWAAGQPGWLPEEFYWVVGCTHRGVPTQTAEIRNPIGASMLIRREVFDLAGGFNSSIGRVERCPSAAKKPSWRFGRGSRFAARNLCTCRTRWYTITFRRSAPHGVISCRAAMPRASPRRWCRS